MSKIVTFGEIMLRLNPKGYERFIQAHEFEISFAGGEANVAVSLANYGEDAYFISKMPANEIGQMCINDLRRVGVNTNLIVRGGERLGAMYLEKGASQRPSKVIYDRAYSAISLAEPSDFDWDNIFEGASWFHFTGITPALGGKLPEICLEAVKKAKEHNVKVSCDLNYRKKLWTAKEANRVMTSIMPYVDICIANEEDAKDVFGIVASNNDVESGKLNYDAYTSVAKQLTEKFNFEKVAITLRGSKSANDNDWAAMLYENGKSFFSKTYHIHIVDRVGGGDSFGGALIYTQLEKYNPQESIEFAAAASCLKHTIEHDYNLVSVEEVKALANGNGSGRVQR